MRTLEENFNFEMGNSLYGFEFDHTFITNPIISFCGRFPASPEEYGFKLLDTRWDSVGHTQEFLLNGKKVLMLITDKNNPVNEKTIQAVVAVCDPDLMEESLEDSIIYQWTISR